jgi:putative PIN family toxin of toxin-antitoxin system
VALRIVLDTNVLVSALRSRNGASFRLLSIIDSGKFELAISVPLVLEYEASARKQSRETGLSSSDIDSILDYICSIAKHYRIYYLWRPFLRDPKDDMVLELAVVSNAKYIVTFNTADFKGIEKFGLKAIKPRDFLKEIGEIS